MAAATLPARAGSASKRKTGTKKPTPSTRSRLNAATARTKQIVQASIITGEILGAGAAASAVAGWRGNQGIKLGPVDGRLIAGLGAMIAGMWDPKTTNQHLVNVGIGVLGSWTHEQAFEMGAKWSGSAASVSSEGVVVGAVDDDEDDDEDESGALGGRRRGNRLARLTRKIQRLKARRARLSGGEAAPQRRRGQRGQRGGAQMVTVPIHAVRPQYRRTHA